MKRLSVALLLVLSLAACSTDQGAKQQPEKPKDEYLTGRQSFQKMLIQAHLWAADSRPYQIESQYTKDAPVLEGKAGVWRARFASAQRSASKPYTWSGVTSPDAPERGVSFSGDDSWSANNVNTAPFDLAYLKKDSNDALTIAQEHGGKKLTDKDPKQPIVFQLDWNPRTNTLVWHVIYGTGLEDAKLRIAVNATTGEFLAVEK